MTVRAVIYARYSSDQQRDASIEDQLRVCRACAERSNWVVVEIFADHALSGATTLRPGYQAMLALLRDGGADIAIAESLDRFSRDQEHIAAFYKQVSFAGARIITLAEGDVTELHIGLKGTMGALYLKDLAAKTRRGLEGRIRQGRSVSTPPYGYRVVRALNEAGEIDRGLREIDPDKARIVQRIFERYAAGTSPRAIARDLNDEGVAGPTGGIWYDATIRGRPARGDGLLRNETYIGRLVWSRRHSVKNPTTGQTVRRNSDPGDVVVQEIPHLRLIDQLLWERVQDRLRSEAVASRARPDDSNPGQFWDRRRPRHLLSGKVFCGLCGRQMSTFGQDYLGCQSAKHGVCRNRTTIRRGILEQRVLDALGRQLMQPDLLTEFIAAYNEEWQRLVAAARTDAIARRRERQIIERKLANLVEAVAGGRARPSLLARIDELEDRIARMPADPDIDDLPSAPALHPGMAELYRSRVANLHVTLADRSQTEALEVARSLIERVIISPPDTDGGPPGVELVGELMAMLTQAGISDASQPHRSNASTAVLAAFVSSVKEVQGAEPPPCLLPTPHSAAPNRPLAAA